MNNRSLHCKYTYNTYVYYNVYDAKNNVSQNYSQLVSTDDHGISPINARYAELIGQAKNRQRKK